MLTLDVRLLNCTTSTEKAFKLISKRILAQSLFAGFAQPSQTNHRWIAAGLATLGALSMVAAFGTAPSTLDQQVERQDLTLALGEPLSVALPQVDDDIYVREERIQRGDTASSLLSRLGIEDAESLAFLRQNPETAAIFRQLSPGKTVIARINRNGVLYGLTFPLNGGRQELLSIHREADQLVAERGTLPLERRLVLASAEIRSSLFAATDAADIPDSIAIALADIFAGDIDFHRDLRRGDRLTVVYESASYLGRPLQGGRVLAAELINNGRQYQAFWFGNQDGQGGYYTADGHSLRKAFLRSPLEFSRITSGFSSARFHPVLKTWRAHKGVDYAAPTGARVRATGDGIVEFAGSHQGYGKVVILQHQGRYTTLYAHLSGFAAGLRKGSRVAQGDVIGFVGATGLATGPHLHYEFRISGEHHDPMTVALPETPPLNASQLTKFNQHTNTLIDKLTLAKATEVALAE